MQGTLRAGKPCSCQRAENVFIETHVSDAYCYRLGRLEIRMSVLKIRPDSEQQVNSSISTSASLLFQILCRWVRGLLALQGSLFCINADPQLAHMSVCVKSSFLGSPVMPATPAPPALKRNPRLSPMPLWALLGWPPTLSMGPASPHIWPPGPGTRPPAGAAPRTAPEAPAALSATAFWLFQHCSPGWGLLPTFPSSCITNHRPNHVHCWAPRSCSALTQLPPRSLARPARFLQVLALHDPQEVWGFFWQQST